MRQRKAGKATARSVPNEEKGNTPLSRKASHQVGESSDSMLVSLLRESAKVGEPANKAGATEYARPLGAIARKRWDTVEQSGSEAGGCSMVLTERTNGTITAGRRPGRNGYGVSTTRQTGKRRKKRSGIRKKSRPIRLWMAGKSCDECKAQPKMLGDYRCEDCWASDQARWHGNNQAALIL